MSGFRLTSK